MTAGECLAEYRPGSGTANGKASGNKVGSVDEVVYKRQQEKSCVESGKVSEWVGRPEVSVPAVLYLEGVCTMTSLPSPTDQMAPPPLTTAAAPVPPSAARSGDALTGLPLPFVTPHRRSPRYVPIDLLQRILQHSPQRATQCNSAGSHHWLGFHSRAAPPSDRRRGPEQGCCLQFSCLRGAGTTVSRETFRLHDAVVGR